MILSLLISLHCSLQIFHILQIEGWQQPCVAHICRHHLCKSVLSLSVFESRFGHFPNSSHFFMIIRLVVVIIDVIVIIISGTTNKTNPCRFADLIRKCICFYCSINQLFTHLYPSPWVSLCSEMQQY